MKDEHDAVGKVEIPEGQSNIVKSADSRMSRELQNFHQDTSLSAQGQMDGPQAIT